MTYKHTKFEDSATMRSLEKLAREKGWVKPEPITKQASTELDLTPSLNLTENIIKLCNGLKKAGFDKYAVELEDKLMAYKKAASLYETSDEKGDDLVDAAHPKGSHKLEGVDSDEATVETILDQHLKLMEVINKKPHGKLASSADILNAVKIALADSNQIRKLIIDAKNLSNQGVNIAAKSGDLYDMTINWAKGRVEVISEVSVGEINNNQIQSAIDALDAIRRNFQPNILAGTGFFKSLNKGLTDPVVYAKVDGLLKAALEKLKLAQSQFKEIGLVQAPVAPLDTDEVSGAETTVATPAAAAVITEKENFQARAKSVLEDLLTGKNTLNDKTKFNDAERAKFFPKIDALVKQVQYFIFTATKVPDVSELVGKLKVIEDWSAKLIEWARLATPGIPR